MTNSLRMDVGKGSEKLVDVQLDFEHWHDSLELAKVARRAVDSFGDVFEDQI
jgi:hypothetical protein